MYDRVLPNRTPWALVAPIIVLLAFVESTDAADRVNWEEAPIRYSERQPMRNAIARLQSQIDQHTIQLEHDGPQGYLRSILSNLAIPVSSQVMVFSKTSLQDDKISPERPRAIYFNDETHVGYVQGGVIEVATADPDLGMVFYTLDPEDVDHPQFFRQANRCLSCHGAARTKSVPGLLVRSVYPNHSGQPVVKAGSFLSNHRSPLAQRWGGWLVTGEHGDQQHLGNYRLPSEDKPKSFQNYAGLNVKELAAHHRSPTYLGEHSDIVALMVLEHQVEAYNLLTQANFVTQHSLMQLSQAVDSGEDLQTARKRCDDRIRAAVQPLAHYLLFAQEARLGHPIRSHSTYPLDFASLGSTNQSSSSRQFDLTNRMFKIPCSYLLYTRVLAEQPPTLLRQLKRDLLAACDADQPYSNQIGLSEQERKEIQDLLTNHPPAWFRALP